VTSRRAVIGVLWATGVGTILYWIAFFSTGEVRASAAPCYLAFEHAFPAADGWMAIACLAAAEGLRRNREWALLWGIAAGSAVVFLGCMDVLYDLENDIYAAMTPAEIGETVINAWCVLVGPALLAYFWRERGRLGSAAPAVA